MLKGECDFCHFYRDDVRLLCVQGFDLGYVCVDCFREITDMCIDFADKLYKNKDKTIIYKDKGAC